MNISRKKVILDGLEEYNNGFSVLTYNILAECNLMTERNELYHYVSDEHLLHDEGVNSYRHVLAMKEIKHFNADVLLLQEVDESYMPIIFPELKEMGYESIFFQKVGVNEGCALCYKQCKFECLETVKIFIHDEVIKIGNKLGMPEEFINRLAEPNVAIISVLKDIKSGKVIICATTHVVFDEFAEPATQALQACLVSQKINEIRSRQAASLGIALSNISVVFGGDFNGEPHHMVIQLMKNKVLTESQKKMLETLTYSINEKKAEPAEFYEVNYVSKYLSSYLENPLELSSAYFEIKGKEPLITCAEDNYVGIADYVFYSSDLKAKSILDIDHSTYVAFKEGGPTEHFSSDHLPLLAEFVF